MSEEYDLKSLFDEYEQTAAITVLDPGKHKLKVASATVKGKGIVPTYTIVEGPLAGKRAMAGGIYPGETEGGRNAFFRKLQRFGLGKEFFAQRPALSDVAKALVGRVVVAELGVEEWQGEPRNTLGFDIALVEEPPPVAIGGASAVPQAAVQQVAATATATTPPVTPTPVVAEVPQAAPVVTAPVVDEDPGF